jgi:hypothetical protein
MVPGVFGAFEALDALGFGFLLVGHLVVSTTPQAAGPGLRIEKPQARRPERQQRTHYGGVKLAATKTTREKEKARVRVNWHAGFESYRSSKELNSNAPVARGATWTTTEGC